MVTFQVSVFCLFWFALGKEEAVITENSVTLLDTLPTTSGQTVLA